MAKSSFVSRFGMRGSSILILLVLFCIVSIPAFCADPSSANAGSADAAVKAMNTDSSTDLLEVLMAKGILTQQEYDALKQRIVPAKADVQSDTQAQAAAATAKMVTFSDKGVGLHVGAYDVTISGELNGFYYHQRGVGAVPSSSAVRSGLLPDYLTFIVSTQQKGWDMSAVFSLCPGLSNDAFPSSGFLAANSGGAGNPTALGISGIDFRQHFVTIGRKGVGTFTVGRNIGYFGDVLLDDFFLLGTGWQNNNANPSNVTLGHIGTGYIYPDFIPQISYATPSYHGLQGKFAVMTPYTNADVFGGAAPVLGGNSQPQYQGKLSYTAPGKSPVKFSIWSDFDTQKMTSTTALGTLIPAGQGVRATGVDYGAKIPLKAAEFVAYGYNGWGIGNIGLFYDGIGLSNIGQATTRYGSGYFFQGTYTVAKTWTFGANYGLSRVLSASAKDTVPCAGIKGCYLWQADSYGGQVRYKLNSWVNLVGDYSHLDLDTFHGKTNTADEFGLGTIVFF